MDFIQAAFKRVALSYTKEVLIYKTGRSNRGRGRGRLVLRTARAALAGKAR